VESNLGYLEFEMCKFLKVTPKELGKRRYNDPAGVYFLESSMINRWNKEAEVYRKQKSEMEHRKHRR